MVPRPLTCDDVAYLCQRCRHMHTSCRVLPSGRVVRSLSRPFPAALPGVDRARARAVPTASCARGYA
jgi:hypothetical protein